MMWSLEKSSLREFQTLFTLFRVYLYKIVEESPMLRKLKIFYLTFQEVKEQFLIG